jgi:hypothetical protein
MSRIHNTAEKLTFLPEIGIFSLKIIFSESILLVWLRPVTTLALAVRRSTLYHNPTYVFPEMKLRGLVPNSYIHVSVSDLIFPGAYLAAS